MRFLAETLDSKNPDLNYCKIYVSEPLRSGPKCQLTNSQGPQKFQPCIFPFTFRKIVFNECTKNSDPEGFFWCSTKVDENGKHVDGKNKWGYCDIDCIEQQEQQQQEQEQQQLQEQEKEQHQQGDILLASTGSKLANFLPRTLVLIRQQI